MSEEKNIDFFDLNKRAVSQPLVTDNYTADPSAHVFDNKIYFDKSYHYFLLLNPNHSYSLTQKAFLFLQFHIYQNLFLEHYFF